MILTATRYSEEYTRLVSAILLDIIDNSRQGDVSLAESIGLDLNAINTLHKLKPDQLYSLAKIYIKNKISSAIFDIDAIKMTHIINAAANESDRFEIMDQFIVNGASKQMIEEFFGMRSTQVATRKRILGVKSIKGRKKYISNEEKRQINQAFHQTATMNDERLRYLHVAKHTNQSLHNVYITIKKNNI